MHLETGYTMEDAFTKNLPNSLYMSHYDLALHFDEFTAEQWRQFLRDNDKFIMREISAITESEARKALQKLSSAKLSAQEVSAIKQLLDRSEQINRQAQDTRTFVTLHMPKTTIKPPDEALIIKELYLHNMEKVKAIYFKDQFHTNLYYTRLQKGEIIENEDGTLNIPRPSIEEDYIYLNIPFPKSEGTLD